METGLARPPLPSYTAITPVSRAPDRTEPATKTDLPATNTVRPATDGDSSTSVASQNADRSPAVAGQRQLERKNIVDPESQSIIFVATDSDSGEVVRQVPSETLRRLRAYAKSVTEQANTETGKDLERTV